MVVSELQSYFFGNVRIYAALENQVDYEDLYNGDFEKVPSVLLWRKVKDLTCSEKNTLNIQVFREKKNTRTLVETPQSLD